MSSGNNSTVASAQSTCLCDFSINTYIYVNNAVVAALHVISAIFAVVSNAVIILTVIKTKSLHRPANLLLSSLAFGDFLVGAVAQPTMASLHLMHNAGINCCVNIVHVAYRIIIAIIACGSFVQVCVLCWDRYKAVSSPLTYRTTITNRKMTAMTATAWIAWVAFIMLLIVIPVKIAKVALTSLALASFIIICVVSQIATLKAMRRHNNQIAAVANTNPFGRERKMAITLRWILGSVILSVVPQIVFNITFAVSGTIQTLGQVLSSPWTKLALCLSSSVNPVIYFWRHENMRSAAVRLFGC